MAAAFVPMKRVQHHRQTTCCTNITTHTLQAARLHKAMLAVHMLQAAAFTTAAALY
jgi:hypothetical protein